jgi:hypothetical protein
MATLSGNIHVTKVPKVLHQAIIDPALEAFIPPITTSRIYLFNMNEETVRPAYSGAKADMVAGEGIVVASGPYVDKRVVDLMLRPDSVLYIVSDEGKDCWVGFLVIE